jgi:alkanesulfonate monooxygenase SsuD/methylene tetrahydromethanopterin reductase-like flavin-dependent oxidoreductase (luciferase family)
MGAKGANFHYEVLARLGYADECAQIQELYLAGDKAAAIAAVPLQMVEDVALVGPPAKIAEELPRWESTVITTMLLSGPPPLLELMAKLTG